MAASPLTPVLATLGAKLSPESDADLLARFAAGDEPAFTALVHRYSRLVWRVARTRCRTEATAEDVFQATFVVLAKKAKSVRTGGALPGWLHRTAHRLAVKAARRERPTTPLAADIPVSADPLDALSARELLAVVGDEMAKLSDAERSVLVLCGLESHSLDEVAIRLGCTTGAVKGRLERSRAKMRKRLDARGLTLPAVVLGLIGGPSANAVRAVTLAALGGAVPPRIESLLSEGTHMTRRSVALGLVAVLVAGGVGTGFGLLPRGGPSAAVAAPVPKEKGSPVVWSEPVNVDWKASRAERLAGVWLPDGQGVLVPSVRPDAENEKPHFGGADLRDADTGKVTKTLAFKHGKADTLQFLPQSLAVSPDGKTVFASGSVFSPGGKGEVSRGLVTWKDMSKGDLPFTTIFLDPLDSPVALSPDGKLFGTITNADTLEVQEATVGGRVLWRNQLGGKGGRLTALTFNAPDGYLAVGTSGEQWVGVNVKTGATVHAIGGLGMSVRTTAASADGKNLAFGGEAASGGQPLVVFAGKEVHKIADAVPKNVAINGLSFSPDNKHLTATCSDGEVRLFDATTGKLVKAAKEHKEAVYSVAYSPDGKKLLTVGKDAIKVWDVEALMKTK